jgi:hypothetical protein
VFAHILVASGGAESRSAADVVAELVAGGASPTTGPPVIVVPALPDEG